MINNFSNTEKSLKRYLKEKVTITTATVVSFLIAGTVAVAADTAKLDPNGAAYTKAETIKEVLKTEKKDYLELTAGTVEGEEFQKAILNLHKEGADAPEEKPIAKNEKDAYIDLTSEALKDYVTIKDNVITLKEGVTLFVGTESGEGQGQALIGLRGADGKTVVNDGLLVVTGENSVGMYGEENTDGAQGLKHNSEYVIVSKAVNATVKNTGDIRVEGENSKGFNVGAGTTAVNESLIVVDGTDATGMRAYGQAIVTEAGEGVTEGIVTINGKNYIVTGADEVGTVLTNKGTIEVINGKGMSIAATGKYIDASNERTIVVNGTDAVGVAFREYNGLLIEKDEDENKETTVFTNKAGGTIEVKEGTGVEVAIADAAFVNEGTITVAGAEVKAEDTNAIDNPSEDPKDPVVTYADAIGVKVNGGTFVNAEGATLTVTNDGTGVELTAGTVRNEGIFDVQSGIGVKIETAIDRAAGAPEYINNGLMKVAEGTVGVDASAVAAFNFANTNTGRVEIDGILIKAQNATSDISVANNGIININEGGLVASTNDKADVEGLSVTNSGQLNAKLTEAQTTAAKKEADKAEEAKAEELEGDLESGDITQEEYNEALQLAREAAYAEYAMTEILGIQNGSQVVSGGIIKITDDKGNVVFKDLAGDEISDYGNEVAINTLNGLEVPNELKVEAGAAVIKADGTTLDGKVINVANNLEIKADGDEAANFEGTQMNLTRSETAGVVSQVAVNADVNFAGVITVAEDMTQVVVTGDKPETTKLQDNATAAFTVADNKTFAFDGKFVGVADSELEKGQTAKDLFYDIALGNGATFEAAGKATTITANIKGNGSDPASFNVAKESRVLYDGTMLNMKNVTVGNDARLILTSTATFAANQNVTTAVAANGTIEIEVDVEGNNALLNSSLAGNKLDFTNSGYHSVELDISGLNGTTLVQVQEGATKHEFTNGSGANVLDTTSGFYTVKTNDDGKVAINDKGQVEVVFDVEEYKTSDSKLDGVLEGIAPVVQFFDSEDGEVLIRQLDGVYADTVYAETVKMSMDTLRMNEDAVLSLNARPEAGKWAAAGKVLYSNTEYDREGVLGDYNVETETTGLMGAVEYGVNETTSVGFAFSGAKQDLDMAHGSAEGDAFYFGAYGNKEIGNIRLTAGLGYMVNDIDADNDFLGTSDSYDTDAFSGYVQGKYILKAGEGFTVEPKAKLALTKLTQDAVKDGHFAMEEVEATTFDVEVGVDVVKTVALDKANLNLIAGLSYTRTMGDTDDEYRANFYNAAGSGASFDVMGANLGENTLKLNLGAEVEQANGFFYNGGASFRFDNEDRESFGLNLGAGYKF